MIGADRQGRGARRRVEGEYHASHLLLGHYGGNCYRCYYDMYKACMDMAGDVQSWVGLARVYFPTATPDILWNLSRHMVASVYFLYFELGGLASDGGRVITEAEWSVLFRSSLISASERKVLERYRGSRFFLMSGPLPATEQIAKPDKSVGATSAISRSWRSRFALTVGRSRACSSSQCPSRAKHADADDVGQPAGDGVEIEANTMMSILTFFIVCFVCLGLKETAVALSDPWDGRRRFRDGRLHGAHHDQHWS